jgi:MYXO-CTERM domain-containing protein
MTGHWSARTNKSLAAICFGAMILVPSVSRAQDAGLTDATVTTCLDEEPYISHSFFPSTVPANAPALPYAQVSSGLPGSGQLRNVAGQAIATTTVDDSYLSPLLADCCRASAFRLVEPQQPLTPGQNYTLDLPEMCLSGGPPPGPFHLSFQAGPPSALPTSIGTVTYDESLGLLLTPSPELAAFLPVTLFSINGQSNVDTYNWYGTYAESQNTYGPYVLFPRDGDDFYAFGCPAAFDAGRPVTQVTETISAHVAGALTDPPPLTATFDFNCQSVFGQPEAGAGGGTIGSDVSSGSLASSGASTASSSAAGAAGSGAQTAGNRPIASGGATGGCAVGRGGNNPIAALAWLALGLALTWRKGRNRA